MSQIPSAGHAVNGWAVDLLQVDKVYKGKVHALRGVDMRIATGEIFGLLGPNGAGKSTLVKILMTVISPTAAQGTVLGMPVGHKPTLARVGYLPEHHKFPEYLTGAQVLDFYGALAGVERSERKKRAPGLLELVGMKEWANTKVRQYSKGMRQRVGIAQAMMNDPDLIVLDEPTDGVDPVGRRDIRNVLLEIKSRGKTVLLNSHLLSELEMVCDRVAILVQGKVASQGTIDELTVKRQRYEIEIAPAQGQRTDELFGKLLAGGVMAHAMGAADVQTLPAAPARGALATGEAVFAEGNTLVIATQEAEKAMPIVDALRARGVVIRAMRLIRPSLEDLFMEAVTDPTTGKTLLPGAAMEGRAAKGGGR